MVLRSMIVALSLLTWVVCPPAFAQLPGIVIALDCNRSDARVELRMSVRNDSAKDSAVVMGNSLGNGRRYLADSFALEVKRGGSAAIEVYSYFDPTVGVIAGRLDPWVIQLPALSSFSLTRPIGHFWSAGAPLTLDRGDVDIRLKLSARADTRLSDLHAFGLAPENLFTGELSAQWRRIPTDCRRSALF